MATEEQKQFLIKRLNKCQYESDLDTGRGIVVACRILGIWAELEPRVRASDPELYEDSWPWW